MGLRFKDIVPGPAGLESPIPGEQEVVDQQQTFGEMMGAPVAQEAQPVGQQEQVVREPAGETLSQEEIEELSEAGFSEEEISTMGQETAGTADPQKEAAKQAVQKKLEETGFFQKLKERAVSGLGVNPKQRASLIKKMIGKKGKTRVVDGGVEFKRPGQKEWQKLDKSFGEGGLSEAAFDIADISGEIVEALTSVGIELPIAAAGTAASTLLGPAAPVGIVPTMAAAATAGAAGGIKAREFAAELFGAEPLSEEEELREIKTATGYNLAFMGAGAILKPIARYAGKIIKGVKGSFPKKIIEKLAVIQKTVDDVARDVALPKEAAEAGEKALGALETKSKEFGKRVGLFKDEAIEAAGDRRFIPGNFLDTAESLFKEQKVEISKRTGWASKTKNTLNLGAEKGSDALTDIISRYNDIYDKVRRKGGVTIDELFDKTEVLGDIAANRFGEKQAKLGFKYSELGNSLTSDKNTAIVNALKGTRSEKEVMDAMETFSSNIGPINALKKMANQKGSGELFVDALVQKGNSERLKNFKKIIGDQSPSWKDFKASWLSKKFEESTDPVTSIFDAAGFARRLSDASLGKEVRKEMLDNKEWATVLKAARDYAKIASTDVASDVGAQNAAKNTILLFSPFKPARFGAMWNLVKGNATAADFLSNRGFVELAEKATTEAEKKGWMQADSILRKVLMNSKKITTKNGRSIYIETPFVRNILRTTADGAMPLNETIGDFEDNFQEAGGSL